MIEILPKWYGLVSPDLPIDGKCFYVGETGKNPVERLGEHLTGVSTGKRKNPSGKVFKDMRKSQGGRPLKRGEDAYLRTKLAKRFNPHPFTDQDESRAFENLAIEQLRLAGHHVYGN